MNQLPQKQENQVLVIGDDAKSVALAIYNRNADAITLRRKMVNFPEVAQALNQTEKFVFVASTKTPIAQIDQQTLISKTKQMFKFIAMDVGFKIPDGEDWTYTRTRLYDLLRKYYSQLTLAEVKLAFELSVTGELDDFLPKNSSGQADKNHYQQFNAAYFTKMLTRTNRREYLQKRLKHYRHRLRTRPRRNWPSITTQPLIVANTFSLSINILANTI
jgi:hypothetical protein